MATVSAEGLKPKESFGEVDEEDKSALQNVGAPAIKKAPTFLRADLLDLADLDAALEKHLSRSTSRAAQGQPRPVEEWELDTTKVILKNVIAQGTYGTVHKGVYDGKDVAGSPKPDFAEFPCLDYIQSASKQHFHFDIDPLPPPLELLESST